MSGPPLVRASRDDRVAVVTLDHPPVNALSPELYRELIAVLDDVLGDPAVDAVVLAGAGRSFSAGFDLASALTASTVAEGDDTARAVHRMTERLEDGGKPTVAALRGVALGGGCELALGCNYRVADGTARLGVPEVTVGLICGGGGTQRLPRLIGVEPALDLMLTGRQVGAAQAAALGLVDEVVSEGSDVVDAAVAFARARAASGGPHPQARVRTDRLPAPGEARAAIDALRARVEQSAGPLLAPRRTMEAVATGVLEGYEAGIERERRGFAECLRGEQSRGLIHFFFAARATTSIPELQGVAPRAVRSVAVIGGGTMGRDIAYANLAAGKRVALLEASQERLDAAVEVVRGHFARRVARGELAESAMAEAVARLTPTLSYDALAEVDLVIEAVVEVMEVKREVFAHVSAAAPDNAVLASNTSTLPIGELARTVREPARVVGLHFFSPARVMKLLEVVRPAAASRETIATALAYARELGKTPVLVGDVYGFVSNRLSMAYGVEALALLEEGASLEQIDGALVRFGMPMGPLQMADMAGVDVGYLTKFGLEAAYPERARSSGVTERLYRAGRFGQKTGRGYYRYEPGQKVGVSDPEFEALLADARRCSGTGVPRTDIGEQEILERVLYATVNEGAHCVGEGVARTPADVDVVFVLGFGFPSYRGGPMHWAEQVGFGRVVEALDRYADQYGERLRPAPWLRERALASRTQLAR